MFEVKARKAGNMTKVGTASPVGRPPRNNIAHATNSNKGVLVQGDPPAETGTESSGNVAWLCLS